MEKQRPMVGVGVMIYNGPNILLGKRKGSHGAGEYAFPGGHLENGESFEDCARREVKEECGIIISGVRKQFVANITDYMPKHYVHIGLTALWDKGNLQVLEPDKVVRWKWYSFFKLPQPLFKMTEMAIDCSDGYHGNGLMENIQKGYRYGNPSKCFVFDLLKK